MARWVRCRHWSRVILTTGSCTGKSEGLLRETGVGIAAGCTAVRSRLSPAPTGGYAFDTMGGPGT